ncbi:MAG: type II toxin-antitoxin system HicA family toxin [Chitinophagaceae bacterium]
MSWLPIIKSSKPEKFLRHPGFLFERQKNRHAFYRSPDGRYTTIPHHPGKDIPGELIRTILKQINPSTKEFQDLLKQV